MIITGCMRSGTRSIARMFGLNHELEFNEFTKACPLDKHIYECSWMAQPFVPFLDNVIFLARNPLHIVDSINDPSLAFWKNASNDYVKFIGHHLPAIKILKKPLDKSIYYVREWITPLLDYPTIRIEDIRNSLRLNSRPLNTYKAPVENSDLYPSLMELVEKLGYECSPVPN